MTDHRFHPAAGPFSLDEIAAAAKAERTDAVPAALTLSGIAPLETAGPDEVSIFYDTKHSAAFAASRAGAIVTTEKLATYPHGGGAILICRDPRFSFAAIGLLFHPRGRMDPGISPRADIHPTASIGEGCRIDSGAVIGAGARIGCACHIGANAVIGMAVEIGPGSVIGSNTTITHAVIGMQALIGAGVVIGAEGFGVVPGPTGLICSAQVGRVKIGDNVRFGSNCTIDRGAIGDTVIGNNTMFDNQVHIAHNVQVGNNCIIAAQTGIAGSTVIGDGTMIGGQVAISDHVSIGKNVRMVSCTGAIRDVADGETVAGAPAVPIRQWHRQNAYLMRIGAARKTES